MNEAQLKMAVKANGEIELTAIVGGEEHKSTVEKQEPEFVDEIYQTGAVTPKSNNQPLNVYQREAEEVIREARGQVGKLDRAYRDGEPIDLKDT